MLAEIPFITVQGRRLEYQLIPAARAGAPMMVFLHEGLGSIAMWRNFPARVAELTGCGALVYSRYGYGHSDVLEAPHDVEYMHREALDVLPELLAKFDITEPILIGQSDGASISLIYAGGGHRARGLVLMAPHIFVEDVTVQSIAAAKAAFQTTDLPQKLGRYHTDVAKTFHGWNDIWLLPEFRAWNIEEYLPGVRCPVLAIQGVDDEYGTLAQIDVIAAQAGGPVELLKLENCKHAPHREQHEATLEAMVRFISGLGP